MNETERIFAEAAARKAARELAAVPYEVGEALTVVEPFTGEMPATVYRVTKAAVYVEVEGMGRFRFHGLKRGETAYLAGATKAR